MQPFFVSEERLARQAYRYDRRYRLAALILIASALLQVPFLALLYYQNRIVEEQDSRRGVALRRQAQITEELGALKEIELQLRQIKSWEPIVRSRMPGSAVLGSVEQTIPQDVVLSRIVMEAANYRLVLLSPGSFRVPQTYTITLEGAQKVRDPALWERFVRRFLSRLPPGSNLVTCTVANNENSKNLILTCKAVLQAQANGNYFPLGVNTIDAEENL